MRQADAARLAWTTPRRSEINNEKPVGPSAFECSVQISLLGEVRDLAHNRGLALGGCRSQRREEGAVRFNMLLLAASASRLPSCGAKSERPSPADDALHMLH